MIRLAEANKNTIRLTTQSNNITQNKVPKGKYDVWVGDTKVIKDHQFEAGAVYTIIVHEDSNGQYVCINSTQNFLFVISKDVSILC